MMQSWRLLVGETVPNTAASSCPSSCATRTSIRSSAANLAALKTSTMVSKIQNILVAVICYVSLTCIVLYKKILQFTCHLFSPKKHENCLKILRLCTTHSGALDQVALDWCFQPAENEGMNQSWMLLRRNTLGSLHIKESLTLMNKWKKVADFSCIYFGLLCVIAAQQILA